MRSQAKVIGPPAARREIVLLPPVRGTPEDALAAGFAEAAARLPEPPRLTLVALAPGSLAERGALQSTWQAYVAPGLRDGRRVWLAGISLGAWLAVLLALRHEGAAESRLAGLGLIAPWLGTRELHGRIQAAGGLRAWAARPAVADEPSIPQPPPPGSLAEEEASWRFLARAAAGTPLWLGFGTSDRFAPAQELLAAALPAPRVSRIDGGHDWQSWARIWEHLLACLPPP